MYFFFYKINILEVTRIYHWELVLQAIEYHQRDTLYKLGIPCISCVQEVVIHVNLFQCSQGMRGISWIGPGLEKWSCKLRVAGLNTPAEASGLISSKIWTQ